MTVLLQEDANKADDAAGLGSPTIGPAPTYYSTSVLGISGNRIYRPSGTIADARAFWDINQVDQRVRGTASVLDTDSCLCFRVVDAANFCQVHVSGTTLRMHTCISGAFAEYFNSGTGYVAAGDILEVHALGEYHALFRNSELLFTTRQRTHITGDGVGVRIASSNTAARWDDIYAWDDVASFYTDRSSWVYKGNDSATADSYGAA